MADVSTYGFTYTLTDKYAEGYTLNAAEAAALNQLRAENISHKVRSALVDGHSCGKGTVITEGSPEHATLMEVAQREDASYEFGQTVTRSRDPLRVKINELARAEFKRLLAKQKPGFKVGKRDGSDAEEAKVYPYEAAQAKIAEIATKDKVIAAAKAALKAEAKAEEAEEVAL